MDEDGFRDYITDRMSLTLRNNYEVQQGIINVFREGDITSPDDLQCYIETTYFINEIKRDYGQYVYIIDKDVYSQVDMDYVDFAVIYDDFMEYIKEFDEQEPTEVKHV